jgi:hypothetical protein
MLESNLRPFHSFRGPKIRCGLDHVLIRFTVESWILENYRAAVRAVRKIQYNLFQSYIF